MKIQSLDQRGFTLIELLIALTILAVGLLSTAAMQVTAMNAGELSNTLSVEGAVAQQVTEAILSFDNNDPLFQATQEDVVWDLDPDTAATSLSLSGAGTFTATYTLTPDNPVANVARIVVTVNGPNSRVATLTSFKRSI